jgi:hypothetical protein
MLEDLTRESFAAHLGSVCRIHLGPARALEMELLEATALGGDARASAGDRPARREPFSVVFRGPRAPILPQRIYRMEHDQMGELDLFIVPIGPDAEGLRYEAVFT